MLDHIQMKFGSTANAKKLKLQLEPSVTIFVGPNNSGKSRFLKELETAFQNGNGLGDIIERVYFKKYTKEEAEEIFESLAVKPPHGQIPHHGNQFFKRNGSLQQVSQAHFVACMQQPNAAENNYSTYFAQTYASDKILSLDGPSRIRLVNPQPRGDLKQPESAFARLFVNDEKRARVRQIIYDATGMYVVFDASVGDQLQLRFGTTPPPDERSLGDMTLAYMSAAQGIENISDGIKAFTGILLQLHAGEPAVITVDEPEAFLHPSLAFKLGKELAKGSIDEGKYVFASTHSAQF